MYSPNGSCVIGGKEQIYMLLTEWDNIGEMAQKSFSAKFYHHAHKLVFVTIFT